MGPLIAGAILIVVLSISLYTDIRYAKILNRVVIPCLPLGLLVWGSTHGWQGAVFSMGGAAVGSVALLISGLLGWMAPGDAKLLVAIGALEGAGFAGSTMIYGAMVGGLLALAILARQRLVKQWATGTAVALSARIPVSSAWTTRAGYIPYSVAIASGAALAAAFPLF